MAWWRRLAVRHRRRGAPLTGRRQGGVDHPPGLVDDPLQVLLAEEALRVDLVDVLGAGRPGGEPAVLGGDLHPADRGAVAWRGGEHAGDRLAGELGGGDVLGRQLAERRLLLGRGRRVDAPVGGAAETAAELPVAVAGVAAATSGHL